MGDSNRIIMIPRAQLHYGYDGESDFSNFNFQQIIRELFFWMDFKLGVQVTLAVDGVCVINDAA
jgi:small basic protein